jgi:catechol 2,3-dioxygenase-like lactoylglutathione lyase family enzyme
MMKKGLLVYCSMLFIKTVAISHGSHVHIPHLSVISGIIEPPSRILNETDGDTVSDAGEMRALSFVQRVCHLEDSIEFYRENFGFQVVSHEEKAGESENAAYSRSTIKITEFHPLQEFSIELLYAYGINRYQRGNDLRGLVFKNSAYKGNLEVLEMDPYGQRFLETPDGHWIILVDDSKLDSQTNALDDQNVAAASDRGAVKFISLCVSNLTSSVQFYANVLGADVVLDSEECSALCIWRRKVNDSRDGSSNHKEVAVELVQLPPPITVDFRASQGLLIIETDEIELNRLRSFAENSDAVRHLGAPHGSATLHHVDEGSLSLSISDEDGHRYSFVPTGAFRRRETSLRHQVITLTLSLVLIRVVDSRLVWSEKERRGKDCMRPVNEDSSRHTQFVSGKECHRLESERRPRHTSYPRSVR